MKHIQILLILLFLSIQVVGQNKKLSTSTYSAYGEYFNTYKNGKKEGLWIETKNNTAAIGIYRNNKRDSVWHYYNLNTGELLKEKRFSNGEVRKIRAKFGAPTIKPNDTLVHINFRFIDKSLGKNHGTWQSNPEMEGVNINVKNEKDSSNRGITILDNSIILNKRNTYKVTLSKKGYITKEILINTKIPPSAKKKDSDTIPEQNFTITMSNKLAENDPKILGKASNIYRFGTTVNGLKLVPDNWYLALQKRKLNQLDEYEKKQKIVDIENAVNEQIINLKEEQLSLENQKKLKEEELRHQEEEVKRKQLELELLAKDKAVSDLTIKAKEAELLRNLLLANEKKKEIENLNQQKLIQDLTIKNNESELLKKNIETANKQKQIQNLEKEKSLSELNIKQQAFIQKLILAGSGLLVFFLLFVFYSLYKSRKDNKLIAQQKTEVEKQKDISERQRNLIQEKQNEIIDSIEYALRIQQATLPDKEEVRLSLPQSFILFKPKDIVSGDFYFFNKKPESIYIAAADCTGHGVPGSLMSMVGSERLTDAVQQSNNTSEILSLLNKGIKKSLKQTDKDESTRDGMDIAICSVDTKNRLVKYAGANRPVWIIRSGQTEVEEIKATKVAIGGLTDDEQHFATHEIQLQPGDTFYIFTDGYADQFSGKDGKKLMTRKFKEILVSLQNKTMQEQEQYLNTFIEDWKAGTEQVDDILVIGIRM
ncbi:MAG: rapF [Bacteroidetes bacterium]|jgi:serine phosphatase RsbU (regulator of sigma subunit)|nr:rapF [Bacteroidota bacterium]